MKKLFAFAVSFIFMSCSTDREEEITFTEKPKLNILVLGNSITKCPSGGEWAGTWGMASSSPKTDFCGVLESSLNANIDRLSIAYWENNFDYGLDLFIVPDKKYDFIIFKVGENVDYHKPNYKEEFNEMINYFKSKANKVIVVSTVWHEYAFSNGNPYQVESSRDLAMKSVSEENNYSYVDISGMIDDISNYAYDQYSDPQIGCHPNDKGMKFIATKILEKIN